MIIDYISPYLPHNQILSSLSILVILAVVSLLAFWITQRLILNLLTKMLRKTSTQLDDILINQNVFKRLTYIVPALIFFNFAYAIPQFTTMIQRISLTLMAIAEIGRAHSELQSRTNLVCRLLLEKKKKRHSNTQL